MLHGHQFFGWYEISTGAVVYSAELHCLLDLYKWLRAFRIKNSSHYYWLVKSRLLAGISKDPLNVHSVCCYIITYEIELLSATLPSIELILIRFVTTYERAYYIQPGRLIEANTRIT